MTALDFPLNPNDGDTHGNYVYDATHGVWNQNPQQLAARFVASDTAPTSPSTGDAWFDTESGKTYVYHDSSWVESGNPVIGYVDPYDQASTSTGYLALPKGTDAQRPINPVNGDMRFNTESKEPEWYSEEESKWVLFRENAASLLSVQYLVIAGGGGAGGAENTYSGGNWWGGAGGAGGYRSSISGESSGGGAVAEDPLQLDISGSFLVSVGSGGPGGAPAANAGNNGTEGEDSTFSSITSVGGGYGGGGAGVIQAGNGGTGGSGGGGGGAYAPSGGNNGAGGSNTANQGYPGVAGNDTINPYPGGGGGGAGSSPALDGRYRGDGVASAVTGSSVTRAYGGYGGNSNPSNAAGPSNSGNGGDTQTISNGSGNNGGSGIVIIKYLATYSVTPGPGLTYSTSTIGDYKITQFTSGTDNIVFS